MSQNPFAQFYQPTAPTAPENPFSAGAETSKRQAVEQASAAKVAAFQQAASYAEKIEKDSWAGQTDMSRDSLGYQLMNMFASATAAGSEAIGNIATAPLDFMSYSLEQGIPEEAIVAFQRYQNGQASEQDLQLLGAPIVKKLGAESPLAQTYRENQEAQGRTVGKPGEGVTNFFIPLDSASGMRQTATEISDKFDVREIVDQRPRENMSRQLREETAESVATLKQAAEKWGDGDKAAATVDFVKGLAGYVANAGSTVLDNPSVIMEYVAEMVPDLALGKANTAVLALRNIGYGLESYRDGIQKYQEENDGRLPTEERRNVMFINAIAAGSTEELGDLALLAVLGRDAKIGETAGIIRRGLKIGKETAESAIKEGSTEALQTYFEGEASLTPATVEDMLEAGTIGAAVGSTIGGGIETARQVAESSAETVATNARDQIRTASQANAVAEARNTGDVTPLIDPTSPTYHPGKAAAVLRERATNQELPEEARKESTETLTKLEETLTDRVSKLQIFSEEGQNQLKAEIAANKAQLDALAVDDENRAALQEMVELQESSLKAIEEMPERTRTSAMSDLKTLEQRLAEVQGELEQVRVETADVKPNDAEALVKEVESSTDETVKVESAQKLVTLLMNNPDLLDSEVVDRLVSSDSFTPAQKQYLRELTDAQVAANAIKTSDEVNQDIFQGSNGFLGLNEHQERMAKATRDGNQKAAAETVRMLRAFSESHKVKAKALEKIQEALNKEMAAGRARTAYLIRDDAVEGGWRAGFTVPEGWDRARNGGLKFEATPKGANELAKLLRSIKPEAAAIDAASKVANSAYRLAFVEQAPVQKKEESKQVPEKTKERVEEKPKSEQVPEPTKPKVDEKPVTEKKESKVEETQDTKKESEVVDTKEEASQESGLLDDILKGLKQEEDLDVAEVEGRAGVHPTLANPEPLSGNLSAEEYQKANLLRYHRQEGQKPNSKTKNPFVAVKDFVTQAWKNPAMVLDFVDLDGGVLSPGQEAYVRLYMQKAKQWGKQIRSNIMDAKDDGMYRYRDPIQFAKDGLPENWIAAIALGAYSWIAEDSANTLFNDDKAIRAILDLTDSDEIPSGARNLFQLAGTRKNMVVQSLGAKIYSSLGMRPVDGAPANEQQRMELSFGNHALALLTQLGYAEEVWIADDITVRETGAKVQPQPFIRVKTDAEGNPHPVVNEIHSARVGTESILSKLFSYESSMVAPSFQPLDFKQERAKKTRTTIAKSFAARQDKAAKRPYQVRLGMQKIRQALDPAIENAIAGYQVQSEMAIHARNLKRERAKNGAILRELDNLREFEQSVAKRKNAPFYLMPVMWLQGRTGFAQNMVNPQTSKLHRFAIGLGDWAVELDPNEDTQELRIFKLAIAQGMGIKIGNLTGDVSLKQLEELMASDIVEAALAAVNEAKLLKPGEKLSPEQQQAILDAVEGREKFHTLSALEGWNTYLMAKAKGEKFSSDQMIEIDGVTNGPALALLLLGQVDTGLGELFGFFTADSDKQEFIAWKNDTSSGQKNDLYERIMSTVMAKIGSKVGRETAAIWFFTGNPMKDNGLISKAGRNLVKQPVTATAFGSNIYKAMQGMQEELVETFYSKLEEAVASNDRGMLEDIIANANILLPQNQALKVPDDVEAALQLTLTKRQERELKESLVNEIGEPFKEGITSVFGGFIENRNKLNVMAGGAWRMYDMAYTLLYNKRVQEKIEAGELRYRQKKGGTKVPLQELAAEDIAAIREKLKPLDPLVHSAASKADNDISSGMLLAKASKKIAEQGNLPYTTVTQFGNKTPAPVMEGNAQDSFSPKEASTAEARGSIAVEADPKGATVILQIHSLDSGIASDVYSEFSALHLHDAEGFGVADAIKGAKKLNEAAYLGLINYSAPTELSISLARSWAAFQELMNEFPELKASLPEVEKQLRSKRNGDTLPVNMAKGAIDTAVSSAKIFALQLEQQKLEYLLTVTSVDQYAFEGGSFQVTEAARAKAETRLTEVKAELDNEFTAAKARAASPKGDAKQSPAAGKPKKAPKLPEPVTPQDTPWGRTGTPLVESDPAIVRFLSGKGQMTVGRMVQLLTNHIPKTDAPALVKSFQLELLKALAQVGNATTKINLVRPDTEVSEQAGEVGAARAWYTIGGAISIKSPDFVSSGITVETLLHEMTHEALAAFIENNPEHAAVKELDAIREKAKQFIQSEGITGFSEAVKDVQEFVAWGMTNKKFQDDVLGKMVVDSTAASRTQNSGFREFIRSLVRILWSDPTKQRQGIAESGLAAMVANVGLLFEAADTSRRGASATGKILKQQDDVDTYTTVQTFIALGKTTTRPLPAGYSQHLQEMLEKVTDVVYGPFGALKAMAERSATMTAEDAFLNYVATGQRTFVSRAIGKLALTSQEAFALESLEVTLADVLNNKDLVISRQELRRLFSEAKKKVAPKDLYDGDWDIATADQKAVAEAAHAFIFTVEANADGVTSDFLSRFAAAAIAYQPLHKVLGTLKTDIDTKTYQGLNLAQGIKLWVEKAFAALRRYITGNIEGGNIGPQVENLAKKLAQVEAKRKAAIASQKTSYSDVFDTAMQSASESVRKKVVEFADSDAFKRSKNTFVRTTARAASTIAGERVEIMMRGIQDQRNRLWQEQQGFFGAMFSELMGVKDSETQMKVLLRRGSQLQQFKVKEKEITAQQVSNAFGKPLTSKRSEAVTRVLLRTDLSLLLGDFSLDQILELVSDPKKLQTEITKVEKEIRGPRRNYYVFQAKALGQYMATGQVISPNLAMNANNIVRMFGTNESGKVTDAEATAAMKSVDQLATLYSLSKVPPNFLKAISELGVEEKARTDGNGLEFVLQLHKAMQEDALENNFEGEATNFMKGYTRDTVSPYVKVETADQTKGQELVNAGWVKLYDIPKDKKDSSDQKGLYILKDAGEPGRISGAMTLTALTARGTQLNGGATDAFGEADFRNNRKKIQAVYAENQNAIAEIISGTLKIEDGKGREPYLVPVFAPSGDVANFRYLMDEATKDNVLERDNRVENVMGAMASHAFDKLNSEQQNKDVVQALYDNYKTNFVQSPEAYIEFGPNSKDPGIRDAYRQLPDRTKREIRKVWGRDVMRVRSDLFDLTFGYRKLSIGDMFDKDTKAMNILEKSFVSIMEKAFGDKAKLKAQRGESAFAYLASRTKDTWVIKNPSTWIGNMKFNIGYLLTMGLSPSDISKRYAEATVGVITYQQEERELIALETQLRVAYLPGAADSIRERIVELTDSMARNPVKPLIDAGLYHTIAEDIDSSEDDGAYLHRVERWVDGQTRKLNPTVRKAGRFMFMTHETPLYRIMARGTHLGDFVSRYALYKHLVEKKKSMSHQEAIEFVDDAFVNYDLPTHKKMQYLNDMTIVPFTKYYMRMQKVMFRLYKDQPGRVLGMAALHNMFSWSPDMNDPLLWEWLSRNPGSLGVMNLPSSLLDTLTMKTAMAPF
jgi:hypothetical protein